MCRIFASSFWMELLLLRGRGLYVSRPCYSLSPGHDISVHWGISIHIIHAYECYIWNNDGDWHNRSTEEEGNEYNESK